MTHCQIVPPYLLEALARAEDPAIAERAQRSLDADARFRAWRTGRPSGRPTAAPVQPGSGPQRVVSDARHTETTPGTKVRGEGDPATGDAAADEAYDGLGSTWSFYDTAYGRNSIDGNGLTLLGTVHYGQDYDNAFWDGNQMIFGDGDGKVFNRFTISVDVIGHELTHGVTAASANLTYSGQSGALNESISDVFGSCVKQMTLGQTADRADWLIGAGLLASGIQGRALRDMLHPGTAYDDPRLGKDPQPADMSGYVQTSSDNGGVHTNSGIPNRAFALAATALGGHSWEVAGLVWYTVLTGPDISADCDFATFANLTVTEAAKHGKAAEAAVRGAWETVGVLSSSGAAARTSAGSGGGGLTAGSSVTVRRSGGFAGLTQEREVTLGELSSSDQEAWQRVLADRGLAALAGRPGHADAFSYTIECADAGVDVTVAEPHLPAEVHDLLRRTLDA